MHVDSPSHQREELTHLTDRPLLEVVPPLFPYPVQQVLIVLDEDVHDLPRCPLLERHLHQDTSQQLRKLRSPSESFHLWELGEARKYNVLPTEFCPVFVEPIRYEDRDVVHPGISWCRTQQNPLVCLSYLQERFHPCARPYHSLLVEYEERSFYVLVLHHLVE